MDSLSGLSDLPLVSGDQPKGWSGRASFRDMAAFNFLPQHIVANPYTLFYKADTSDHREKLTRVFPVVLGTKTNEQLVLEHRLFALEAEERRISAELRRRRGSIDTWRSQATGAFLRAQELNLLPAGELPATVNGIAAALQTFADSPSVQLRRTPSATTREAVERIERLRREEDEANRKLGEARRRLRRLRTLDATVSEYGSDLLSERNRVKGIDWFANAVSGDHECPLCGTTQSSASVTIEQQ
jgi:DNA repair exonuclease SbcCD ATPase subunit